MKLYSAVLYAVNSIGPVYVPATILAENEDEATGKALKACYKQFPGNGKDYWHHSVGVSEVPQHMIDKVK